MPTLLRTRTLSVLTAALALGALGAQEPPYQSKMADLGEIRLQYMDFGGNGLPLIWVQDFHNYFEGAYQDPIYLPFFAELARDFRVLAPLRRGYGASTNTEWGYDVATQSEDLLRFMDALAIDKAVLYGRLPANQDMTWIAEHHPERLAGLIYVGNPILVAGCSEPEVLAFIENWSALAPDFDKEKEKRIVMSRAYWQPHFLHDANARIDVPALRFINPVVNQASVHRRLLESGSLQGMIQSELPGREAERAYLRDLLQDSARVARLREQLTRCDQSDALDQGMERTFGSRLRTVVEEEFTILDQDFSAYLNWQLGHIRTFARRVQ